MPDYRSRTSTHGRNMAGARALWRATGMKDDDFHKPIVAIANSFTQFVPGHVHLKDLGQLVAREVERVGGVAKEFNTIAVDDGIAMGHDGMLYSLPSREVIADSVEYMVNAHCADALVCISNCDKITPGMLMAALRLNIPTVFVSGGPMRAGRLASGQSVDLMHIFEGVGAFKAGRITEAEFKEVEDNACPTCGSCSGMFTANSMNCLSEALGLALPGNGTYLADSAERAELVRRAARQVVRRHPCRRGVFRRARLPVPARDEPAVELHRELRIFVLQDDDGPAAADLDAELLPQLAAQRTADVLARLDLAAGELPQPAHRRVIRPLHQQDAPFLLDYGGGHIDPVLRLCHTIPGEFIEDKPLACHSERSEESSLQTEYYGREDSSLRSE